MKYPNPTRRDLESLRPLVDPEWSDQALDRLAADVGLTVSVDASQAPDLAEELARVAGDMYVDRAAQIAKDHGKEMDAAYRGWAEASFNLGVSRKREELIQERLDTVAAERDDARNKLRRARGWQVWFWIMALLAVWIFLFWRLS